MPLTTPTTVPAQGANNVVWNAPIVITYNEAIDPASVDQSSVTVTSKKTNIIQVENGLPQPGGIFSSDDFFTDEFTGVVSGQITVSGADVTFTPDDPYEGNTEYTVNISSAVAATSDGSTLGVIKYFTFTTAAEDTNVMEPLPDVAQGLTTIVGTDLQYGSTSTTANFRVTKTSPTADSFLNSGQVIKVTFSMDLEAAPSSKVTVNRYDLFSDYPPTELVDTTDYNVTVVNNRVLTITLTDSGTTSNSIYEVVIDQSITDTGATETLTEDYTFTYISAISPYYTSTKLIRLKAGTVLTQVTDVNLAIMIHYASIEADQKMSKLAGNIPASSQLIMRGKYAMYTAIENVLMNNYNFGISDYINKQLAEFSLAVSNKTKVQLYNSLIKEAREFKQSFDAYLNFGAGTPFFRRNTTTNDIGRMWRSGYARPGLNTKVQDGTRMRHSWDTSPMAWNEGTDSWENISQPL